MWQWLAKVMQILNYDVDHVWTTLQADSSVHPVIKGQAIYGLAVAPKYDQTFPAFHPSYSQNYEVLLFFFLHTLQG